MLNEFSSDKANFKDHPRS